MQERPTLNTVGLLLRTFTLADAPDVQRLAGDQAIAATTLNIPHPYEDGIAENWIATHQEQFEKGKLVNFAIIHRAQGYLIGAIGLTIDAQSERAELGYWIGKPFWLRGYCTEAARAVVAYGFETLGLQRICAHHFQSNLASGRVMQKLGMTPEGLLRRHVKKADRFEDIVCYGILRPEYAGTDVCLDQRAARRRQLTPT